MYKNLNCSGEVLLQPRAHYKRPKRPKNPVSGQDILEKPGVNPLSSGLIGATLVKPHE
jgi:hypothetical protein